MSEVKIPIPAMIYNKAVGGHVTNSQQIIDENINREQSDVNQEVLFGEPYNSTTPNGMGRIILKKNDNFKTVVEAQTDGNTIFVIKYDFTLTDNVTIPANCVLEFEGGSISASGSNDTITGQNTGVNAGLVKIFNTDVILAGSWNVAEAYPEWWGAKGDGVTDDTDAVKMYISFAGVSKIYSLVFNKPYLVSEDITVTKSIDDSILILKECSLILNEKKISITNSTVYFTGEDSTLINTDVIKVNKSQCSLLNTRIEPYNDDGNSGHTRCHSCIKVDSVEGLWGVIIDDCRLWKSVIGIFVYSGRWITASNFINNKIGCYLNYGILFDDTTAKGITHCNIENNKFERINTDYNHGKPVAIKLTNWGHTVKGNTLFDDDSNAPLAVQSTFIQYSDSVFEQAIGDSGLTQTVLNWMKGFSSIFIENNIVEGTFDLGDFRNCFQYNNNLIVNHTGNVSGNYDELGDTQRNFYNKNAFVQELDLSTAVFTNTTGTGNFVTEANNKDFVTCYLSSDSPEAVRIEMKIPLTVAFNALAVKQDWAILYFATNMYGRIVSDHAYYYNDNNGSIGDWVNYSNTCNAVIIKNIKSKLGGNPSIQMYYTIAPGERIFINKAVFTLGLNNMFKEFDKSAREIKQLVNSFN